MGLSSASWRHAAAACFVAASAISAHTQINPSAYPSEALKLADTLAPELADSIKTCSIDKARSVHARANEFINKTWSWSAHYEQLKPYRACFQMLSDIAATTLLVTDRLVNTRPNLVAGLFDANYAACRVLSEPTYRPVGVSGNMPWPARFGSEPSRKPCR